MLTYWYDKKSHVAEPVWGFVRQLFYKEPQHSTEVILGSRNCNFNWIGRLRIAVAAEERGNITAFK